MNMSYLIYDLEFWLVSATAVCGIVWFIYWLMNIGKTKQKPTSKKNIEETKEPIIVEYAKAFFPVLLLVILLRSFLAEPFRIPSGSMMPTLEVGDFILVNKFAYGIRLPVIRTKILDTGKPERGDVFVFRFPQRPWQNFIKRAIGLPGDKISWDNEDLYINGTLVSKKYLNEHIAINQQGQEVPAALFQENLGDIKHEIIFDTRRRHSNHSKGSLTVPEGHYFAVGDNRFGSHDSRAWGFVPEANLVGRAMFVWMHYSGNDKGFDLSRIGTAIK